MPSRGRRLALGATAVVTVGLAGAYASTIGAQAATDPIVTELVSIDGDGVRQDLPDNAVPAMSDTGGVVAYETAGPVGTGAASPFDGRRVWIRDRVGDTSRSVAENNSVAPGVSGDGCLVAYTVVGVDQATLTAVDRCATAVPSPLPGGTKLDTVTLDALTPKAPVTDAAGPQVVPEAATSPTAIVAAPSLSFDGSTIVWSTGREVRRYVRPAAGEPFVRSGTFDVIVGGSTATVTGVATDVSSDGNTVVFVAGPGTSPFEPATADVYVWTSTDPQADPELLSATSSGDPATSDSTSPTITSDGAFVVFQSSNLDLPVVGTSTVTAPFVVGVDLAGRTAQILVDDADRPAVSADGQHVVYRRGEAIRLLSSDGTSTTDHGIDELVDARPIGALSISQFGRWIVYASAVEPTATPTVTPEGPTGPPTATPAVWAIDRASSNTDVVDTTTSTTAPTTTVPASTTPPPTTAVVDTAPTVPAATLPATPVVPPSTTVGGGSRRVPLPAPRPTRPSSPAPQYRSPVDTGVTAYASPVTFDPTVVAAGRRIQPVILTNAGSRTVQVAGVSIDVQDAFTVVGDSCSAAPVAAGSSCSIEVQFAPVAVGAASAVVTFELSDGPLVTALVDGQGVPEPTLDLVPEVAGAGQTVSVFGAGFPPGATVELTRPGTSIPELIVVDPDGTFAHVIVVLPNTPVGPTTLTVQGQPDAFDDVGAELLVSNRRAASADAALRVGPAGSFGR